MCGIGDPVELARRICHIHPVQKHTDNERDEQPILEGFRAPLPTADVTHPSGEEEGRRDELGRPPDNELGIIRGREGIEGKHKEEGGRQDCGQDVDYDLTEMGSLWILFIRLEENAAEEEHRQEHPRGRPGPRGPVRGLEPSRPTADERRGDDGVVPIQQSGTEEASADEQESFLFLTVETDERKAPDDQGQRGADEFPDDMAGLVVIEGKAPQDDREDEKNRKDQPVDRGRPLFGRVLGEVTRHH